MEGLQRSHDLFSNQVVEMKPKTTQLMYRSSSTKSCCSSDLNMVFVTSGFSRRLGPTCRCSENAHWLTLTLNNSTTVLNIKKLIMYKVVMSNKLSFKVKLILHVISTLIQAHVLWEGGILKDEIVSLLHKFFPSYHPLSRNCASLMIL